MLMAVFATTVAYGLIVKNHLSTPYDKTFDEIGRNRNVDSNLLRAIGRHETGFVSIVSKPNANGTKDYGIMQINETNFRALGLDANSAMDISKNIDAAARLLVMMKNELGERDSLYARISAYNIGSPTVIRRGIVNDAYVSSVYWHYTLYQMGRVFH